MVGYVLVIGALLAACSQSQSPPASLTSGIVKVQITSTQALAPPNGVHEATLTTAASLSSFEQAITSDDIALTSATTTAGCAGGIQYTLLLIHKRAAADVTLSAYACAGSLSGNMKGNVQAFVSYVSSLLP